MRMLRVIEATQAEIIEEVERRAAEFAERADSTNPKAGRTAKEREAHQAVSDELTWVVELLRDWKIVESGGGSPSSNGNGSTAGTGPAAVPTLSAIPGGDGAGG